jgi:Ca2+-binding RTX toxin-like protein
MKLPVPTKQDTTVILETYSKNELPFKFSEVQISINGPDIVVKTADGHTMTFPFAAQFATMGKQVFTLVFADGKEIPSDQLLAYVTTVNVAPNAAAPVAHHDEGKGTAEKENAKDVTKEVTKEVTKVVTKEEIVVVESPPQENAGAEHTDAAHKQAPVVHPGDLSKHRFDEEALPRVDQISGMPARTEHPPADAPPSEPTPADAPPAEPTPAEPTPVEPTPVDPTPAEPTPAEPTPVEPTPVDPTPPEPTPAEPTPPEPTPPEPTPPEPTPPEPTPPEPPQPPEPPAPPAPPVPKDIVLLKTQAVVDQLTHDYVLGGGNDAARTDGRISTQYASRDVDLSGETEGWTIHADTSVGVAGPGSMIRIINVGSASGLLDVSVSPELAAKGVSVVTWNSDEGIALGLKHNEFALRYPTSQDVLSGVFNVHLDFVDSASGETASSDIAFQVIDSPTALRNENDVYQLSRHENDVSIHAGSGDDTIIAGRSNGVYDGGAGVNTLDYSGFSTALTVDLSADVRSAVGLTPTGAITTDMGRVKSGETVHSIENIQVIKGGSGANTFIGNEFDHEFVGGASDNTFIANGGNNVYTGGSGHNLLDYSRAGGTAFETVTLGASGRKMVLDGVDIDMSKGLTSNNGWMDANGKSGVDHFSGAFQITGSTHNDRIRGGDGDDVILAGAGDDLIIGSAGNDKIDGGAGFNTISYAEMKGSVDVDLNTGRAVKSVGGVDSLSHIQAVIGAAGGGTLSGLVGSNNLLVGTSGGTRFVVNAGTNQLYGGTGNNTFDLTQGTNTVVGGGASNTVRADGGANTFQAGDGVNVFQARGGVNVFKGGAGNDTFTSTEAGNNTLFGGSGTTVFRATGGGSNAITGGSGSMHVYSGGANNTVKGGSGGSTTVDYSGYEGEGRLDIAMDRNLALVGNDFVDRLFDIDVIIGNKGGNSTIRGGSKGIEIHVSGDNNVLVGGLGNNVFDGGSGKNNTIDYSNATSAVDVNLNTGVASKNGYGFTDRISNIQKIIGSNLSGNVFEGKNGVDNWIDLGGGANNKVFGSSGNDTFVSHNANNTVDYSKLSAAMSINTSSGIVLKGVNGADKLVNAFGTVIGTNYGDVITVSGPVNILAGSGNDKIIFTGPPHPTTIDGGGGRNELDATNATSSGAVLSYTFNADGRSGTMTGMNGVDWIKGTVWAQQTSIMAFKNIDVIDGSAQTKSMLNWGSANHITYKGAANTQDYLFVNGGGNRIDGGYTGAGESIPGQQANRVSISYAPTSAGIIANLETGVVSFADGRDADSIKNFSRFVGTQGDDIIKGHANVSDWINASSGNDIIDAGGGTTNVYSMYGDFTTNADFNTGVIQKYTSTGVKIGTDMVTGFQQYNGGEYNGDIVHGKDGVNMLFWMGNGGTKTLLASKASNNIDGGSSSTTVDYSGMTKYITVDLTGNKVTKGGSDGTDTFANIAKIVGTAGDDVFTFNTQADVIKMNLNGGGGNDTLNKVGSANGTFDLNAMLSKVTSIQKIDFSTSTASDKISIDFTALLARGNETLTLNTTAKDTVMMAHNTAMDGWTHTTESNGGQTTDTYALGGHQLIWNH